MDSSGGVANTRVEFMLNRFPGAVGDIVEVNGGTPSKMSNAYAVAHTGGGGQATATLTATRPGSADITAFVPAVVDPNAHKKFGVVHWVDGCPSFPPDAENPVGMDHPIPVSVMNVSDGSPVAGVPFRFQITDDEPNAAFAGADGDGNVIMGTTDENGMVTVTLSQETADLGDNAVHIEMLSEAGETMFSHTMTKVWKSPVLGITAVGPATIGLLREATYDVALSNSGDFAATDAVLTMALPAGLSFVSSSMPATASGAEPGQMVEWQIGDMPIGQTTMLTVTAQGVITGLQTSDFRLASAEGLSAEASVATTVVPGVLEVRKTGPATVGLGADAAYTIQALSAGTGASTEVRLVDTIPAGMSFVSADRDSSMDGNQVVFELGTLDAGNVATVQIVLRAEEPGAKENVASATSAEGGSAEDSVTTQVVSPALSVSKTGPASMLVNTPFDYIATVSNTGDGVASNVMLTDTLPAGLQFVSANPAAMADGQTVSWSLGSLQPGASRSVTVTVMGVARGEQENTVTASADGGVEPATARATTSVTVPAISLEKAGRSALFIGNQATYELTATNTGDSELTAVTITETIPNGMSYVSSNPTAMVNGSQLTWQVGGLAVGAETTVSVTLMADAIGMVANAASVTSAEGVSATSTLDIEVLAAAGATIRITDSVDPVREGEALDFTVTVSNQGRSAITGVRIEVDIPGALAITGVSDAEATISEDRGMVTLVLSAALGVDETRSFTISAVANELPAGSGGRSDTITTATLTYNEFSLAVSADEGTTVIER